MPPAWVHSLQQTAERLFAFDPAEWPQNGDSGTKIIHDAVWGSRPFMAWERAVIDLPALQRLRSVKQLSMAHLVYPTAMHTRFEHSLGVASIAKDMLRYTGLQDDHEWSDNTIGAALLHDIGHGPFSHLSEETYYAEPGWFDGLIGKEGEARYPSAQPHEAIGAELLLTDAAKRFFNDLNDQYRIDLNPKVMASFITGNPVPGRGAYSAIVNGPTDADKVDYLVRDGYFSGIPLSLDVNRLLLALDATERDALIVGSKGMVPAEQITFAKATLTSALYHHHKVRASDCAFKGFADRMIRLKHSFGGREIGDPNDMLCLSDADILSDTLQAPDPVSQQLLDAVRYRRLPVTVLDLRFSNVDSASSPEERFASYEALRQRPATMSQRHETYKSLREVAEKVWEQIGDPDVQREEVWVDLPPKPKIGGVEVEFGHLTGGMNTFPTAEWTRLYGQYKYKGHVFVPRRVRERGRSAAREVLKELGPAVGLEPEV